MWYKIFKRVIYEFPYFLIVRIDCVRARLTYKVQFFLIFSEWYMPRVCNSLWTIFVQSLQQSTLTWTQFDNELPYSIHEKWDEWIRSRMNVPHSIFPTFLKELKWLLLKHSFILLSSVDFNPIESSSPTYSILLFIVNMDL